VIAENCNSLRQGVSAKPRRRSLRLPACDYSLPGRYFVTVCTQNRECLFGEIKNREMVLNEIGKMVQTVWDEIPQFYPGVEIDAFVIMPNHVHGIIVLTDTQCESVGAGPRACPSPKTGQPQGVAPTFSLGDVVHRFKSLTTARCRLNIKQSGCLSFSGRLWQRNYYEHIIRTDNDLNKIREYILLNPSKWAEDNENPKNVGAGTGARRSPKMAQPHPKNEQPQGVAPTDNR